MAVTAKELASQLGLSEAAVSLALNNKPGVSTETRRRVLEAARAGGYDLTGKAQALKAKIGAFCFVIYKKSGAVVDDTPFFSANAFTTAAATPSLSKIPCMYVP